MGQPPRSGPLKPPPPPAGSPLAPQQLARLDKLAASLDELDYFQLLALPYEAPPGEVKKAFYRDSRTYHPDRFFHLADGKLKERINEVYKRITEAYYVLRDDTKRRRYVADVRGPDRAKRLRFSDVAETEAKQAVKREQEEQIGTHPKGRQFFQTATQDLDAQRWAAAERNLKMALTYEPKNERYKEKLAEAQKRLHEESKKSGDPFKIR